MDAFSDPNTEGIVFVKCSQVGATEILNNIVGYYIDQDPSPILVMQPTQKPMAESWSKDRLAPMLRDTPRLRGKVQDPRARDSGNTILHKIFPGGHITCVGANAPSGLAARPIRVLLCDEVDRYVASAGAEGDPINLAKKRQDTFWNRKRLEASTPTIKGLSRIEKSWEFSDQRRYYVPCPNCHTMQTLKWEHIKWETHDDIETAAASTKYCCPHCGTFLDEADKPAMLKAGEWRAERPGRRIAGFHLNALYSPWKRWVECVREFLESKDDPLQFQVFVNTVWGETWEERGEQLTQGTLAKRAEVYAKEVPMGVAVLTAGVDVQQDRLELLVVGWGDKEESWRIHWESFQGDPWLESTWALLEAALVRTYTHESGAELRIQAVGVDSGDATTAVYGFCAPRWKRRVYAMKGRSTRGTDIITRPSKSKKYKVKVWPVGTDKAKDTIFARLKMQKPGPGYWHFPTKLDPEYYQQLTAEKAMIVKKGGQPARVYVKTRDRNEALDLEVYALAALHTLGITVRTQLGQYAKQLRESAVPPGEDAPGAPDTTLKKQALGKLRRKGPRSSWVNRFR